MAPVGNIPFVFGKKTVEFGLLSVEDLIYCSRFINSPEVIDISALEKFSKNVKGCEVVLLLSRKKVDPNATEKDISALGSILRRTQVSNEIFIKSVVNGEEDVSEEPTA